ncbi:DUF2218 domain-containing protein [Streptomyces formicae]|uniref:DUF2218 domain-containing protein n=1 Tax=Streptomyces formicae TaxID=1616117 RepID=A0ABY3WTH7_9ACTN|nr:DUF2218 domain-containing protein [Streptomyces formicae]UNM13865.1 DUF2218 domain-containing protein [Streptomyces formicae]
MPIAEARVETERPSRYLVQLCKHFAGKGRHLGHRPLAHRGVDAQAWSDMRAVAGQAQVTWSDNEGEVTLPWGRIFLRAAPGALELCAEGATDEDLRRLQDLAAGHVERFGRREGLQVRWRQGPGTAAEAVVPPGAPEAGTVRPRRHLGVAAVVAVVALALVVHLGLGGAILANLRWTGWAVGGVVAMVLVKAIVLGGFAVHRRRS